MCVGIVDRAVAADPSPPGQEDSALAVAESQTPFRGLKIKANTGRFSAAGFW